MRELRADDRDLLLEATLCNVNWVEERFTRDDVLTNPYFRHYHDPWQESDFGYVAENSNGRAIGVVWLRFFTADDPGFGFVDEATPELSIWVAEGERGRGNWWAASRRRDPCRPLERAPAHQSQRGRGQPGAPAL